MKRFHSHVVAAGALLAMLALQACDSKPATSSAKPKQAASTGKVHTIKMRGTASGFFFEPSNLSAARGDKVVFTLVDGAPHNVSFNNQQLPSDAPIILEREGRLIGTMLQAPGQTYELLLAKNLPTGEYNFVCDPHAPLGMKGKITVTP